MESIWEVVISNGIFACLFVWLLFYQIKDSSRREKKYIEIISQLAKDLDVVEDVKEDVGELKAKIVLRRGVQNERKTKKL